MSFASNKEELYIARKHVLNVHSAIDGAWLRSFTFDFRAEDVAIANCGLLLLVRDQRSMEVIHPSGGPHCQWTVLTVHRIQSHPGHGASVLLCAADVFMCDHPR